MANINVRVPVPLRDALDAWCLDQPGAPCRSEGIRRLLEGVLGRDLAVRSAKS